MIARQIMTKEIITVTPSMTVKSLANTLIKNQISGAPVTGKDGKIIGIVSRADIVGAIARGEHIAIHTPVYDL